MLQVHKGEKPFKCNVCGDGFKFKILLKKHLQKFHEEKDVKMKYSQNPEGKAV